MFQGVLNMARDELAMEPFPPIYLIVPSIIFLAALPIRLWQLWGTNTKVVPSNQDQSKVATSFIYLIFQLVSLILLPMQVSRPSATCQVSGVVSFVAALGLCLVSYIEHRRSIRPSTLITVYLTASLIGHVIELTVPGSGIEASFSFARYSIPSLAKCLIELVFLLNECHEKRTILKAEYHGLSPEETAGALSKTLFWWINPILAEGIRSMFSSKDIPITDKSLSSKYLRREILLKWNQRGRPENASTLPLVLLRCLLRPFLSAILPRLFLVTFRYSQALLISKTIRFINSGHTIEELRSMGYWLVVAAVLIYVGMAISSAAYQHQLNILKVMTRGALVGLIYHRSLEVSSCGYEDGNAVTLMSSDVDNLSTAGEMFHETWAQVLEVLIGLALLANQLGWIWPLPLFFIFLCSKVSQYVAKNLKKGQRNCSQATQNRLATTASMLGSNKSMKMLGITNHMKHRIQDLRQVEIQMAIKLRWVMVAYNASANALGIFTPVITLIIYTIALKHSKYGKLTTDMVFTSIAILGMITHPANMVMTIVPRAVASMANFERVQGYLLLSSVEDHRILLNTTDPEPGALERETGKTAILLQDLTIQYSAGSPTILMNTNLRVKQGSIVMCSGPVGVGKSSLVKAVLGEVAPWAGSVSVFTKGIGYCAQIPWLPSGTIKQVICGNEGEPARDMQRYSSVITTCELSADLDRLPDKDNTQVGSRGFNLSGGQRQRVALARVLYARYDLVVLDDSFSALDGKTEARIIENLVGPNGLFRRQGKTVFMVTHAAQHFPLADHILILVNPRTQIQGSWEEVSHMTMDVTKIMGADSHNEGISQITLTSQVKVTSEAIDITRETEDFSLYSYYFQSVGYSNLALLLCCTICYAFFLTFSQYWLKLWTEDASFEPGFYMAGYFIITLIAWIATNGTMWSTFIRMAPKSGIELHNRLLNTMIRAPLSYYSENEIGVMLNRFGQDLQLVDVQLPGNLSVLVNQIFKLSVQTSLLFVVQNKMVIVLPFCILVVYIVQKIYLQTSRQLRFIEIESRSAVYSSFLETVDGSATIRALGLQKDLENHNLGQLESSQRPFYLLLCLQRWLNLVLDLVIAGIAVGVIALAVVLHGTSTGGQIGVALNLIIVASTTLLRLVESWTSLEISLGAISRIKSVVNDTPNEDRAGENFLPDTVWPSAGRVELRNVTVSYNPNAIALKDVSFSIDESQKVVICGRTGSGKSTLLLTLLCMLDLQSGSIVIDNINISKIPRSILRQRCFITVPQDPFIFSNSNLRFNLDPTQSFSNETLVEVLKKTRLWQHFLHLLDENSFGNPNEQFDLPERIHGILEQPLSLFPPLSTGQLQLLSIARAILRVHPPTASYRDEYPSLLPNITRPILLLDEATSSLDPDTEEAIQDIIQEEFTDKGHTVIIVAHRMSALEKHMRKGRDAIIWMSAGGVEKMEVVRGEREERFRGG
ncbi:ABC transporter [Tricladium varicosporioides]|nr:ABC transporter [Hymenoscyphus varicosporioides]